MTHAAEIHAQDALWYARAVLEDPDQHDTETIDAACTLIVAFSDDPKEQTRAVMLRLRTEGGTP